MLGDWVSMRVHSVQLTTTRNFFVRPNIVGYLKKLACHSRSLPSPFEVLEWPKFRYGQLALLSSA